MCKSCDRPHPTYAECHQLFYLHNGVLHRSPLPRSMFNRECSYKLYHHPDRVNKPVTVLKHNSSVEVLGYGQRPVGVILAIMDGKKVEKWYHRADKPKHSCNLHIDDDFRQYPKIPKKIYKHGFLQLKMEMQR